MFLVVDVRLVVTVLREEGYPDIGEGVWRGAQGTGARLEKGF